MDRYLDDLERRYGGIDSVLLWSIYPNIGIDARNQQEMIEQLPGGVAGVRQLVADFQRRGVGVLFPIMPWDTGGNPLPGMLLGTLADSMAALMKQVGADGVNGDPITGVPEAYSLAAERIGHPLAFEPEIAPKKDQLGWNLMTWGYFEYAYAVQNPAVHVLAVALPALVDVHHVHTRAAVLRGGSRYRPKGSHWYFPQALRLDTHGKFLLMAPSMDRNAMTGLRCVRNAPA